MLETNGRRNKDKNKIQDIKDLEKQKYQKSLIKRLSKSFGMEFHIDLNNITNVDQIGKLNVAEL